jgi:mannose-6-phosphate isomerase-like protein (cupin superfamily)
MKTVNIKEKFDLINNHWSPKIVGELNNQQIRLAKFQGEFKYHKHDNEDEMFLVIKGEIIVDTQTDLKTV